MLETIPRSAAEIEGPAGATTDGLVLAAVYVFGDLVEQRGLLLRALADAKILGADHGATTTNVLELPIAVRTHRSAARGHRDRSRAGTGGSIGRRTFAIAIAGGDEDDERDEKEPWHRYLAAIGVPDHVNVVVPLCVPEPPIL